MSKSYKAAKFLSFRLAEMERKLAERNPRVAGARPIVVQPQTIDIAFEEEDERVAVGIIAEVFALLCARQDSNLDIGRV